MVDELPQARCPGLSWDDLAAADPTPPPAFLAGDHYRYLGSDPIPTERYTSAAFARLEAAYMWPNVWQFAAREEELLTPGQSVVYDNAGRSYVLVRQTDGSIRAFHNVCLHRGRQLRQKGGQLGSLTCKYHGWSWGIDGRLKSIPCAWDFQHLKPEELNLPEAEVGRWQGYVFIRENAGGPSLEEYLAPLSEHFDHWRHDECYTAAWVAQVIPANWKVVMEAFLEAYHVVATHPSMLPYTGDANTKTYVLGENTNLMVVPFLTGSPHAPPNKRGEQWLLDQYLKDEALYGSAPAMTVPEGATARSTMAGYYRTRFGGETERDMSGYSDAEMIDGISYHVFPNFSPWASFIPNLVYRWRPAGDENHCLYEVRILNRLKPGQAMPPAPPMQLIPPGESWEPALGRLGGILMEDIANMAAVQTGLKASKTGVVQLGNYQEVKIRHFHQTLQRYIDMADRG